MHLKSVVVATTAAMLALGTLSASSAGISLASGYYSGTSLITSTSGTCPVAAGDFNIETVYFPGENKAGYITRTAYDFTDLSSNHWVGFQVFTFNPKAPKAGVTTWSGSGSVRTTLAENGTNQTPTTVSFTFNETWTYVDAVTYYKTGTTSFTGGCTVSYQKTRTFSGAN